ncbi:neuropeptide FF receptor 2-like [Clytia hemisphaerica]|uniref:neuropeptide FF receptor 2-like n=1 Tax=Clytia hemisphaerica TaxID=252671 RepID=UPI0034D7B23C
MDLKNILDVSLCILIFIIGVPGNCLIFCFYLTRSSLSKMSTYHFFILQLALSDFIICIGLPVVEVNDSFAETISPGSNGKYYFFGKFICEHFVDTPYHISPAVSAWMLVALSFERYWKIVNPFKRQMNKKVAAVIAALVWCTAYCAMLPLSLRFKYDEDTQTCENNREDFFAEFYHSCVQSLCVECIFPSLAIGFLYKKTKDHLMGQENDPNTPDPLNEETRKRRIKAVQTIKWLYCLFLATMLPGRIVHVVRSVILKNLTEYDLALVVFIMVFEKYIYCNNTINVFIYAWKNRDFRNVLKVKLRF